MRYTVISFIVLLCWVFDTHAQQYHISTDHPAVTFEKENPLFLSIYSWPETLIRIISQHFAYLGFGEPHHLVKFR